MSVKESRGTFNIAASYIGAVIGAGFLSGQEIFEFFLAYGKIGIIGALLAGIVFGALGSAILSISQRLRVKTYNDFLSYILGSKFGRFMDVALFCLCVGTVGIMLAGSGQLFYEQFEVPKIISIGVTAIVLMLALNWGMDSVLWVNNKLVPILICVGLFIAGAAIWKGYSAPSAEPVVIESVITGSSGKWILSALLYVTYNAMLSLSFLAPLGGESESEDEARKGGWLGGLTLGIMATLISIALWLEWNNVSHSELPLLILARRHGAVIEVLYIFGLWAAIFTTALSNLYGLALRLGELMNMDWKKATFPLLLGGILLSYAGFSKLIGIVYPFFGFVGLPFLFMSIAKATNKEGRFISFFQKRG